MKIMMIIAALCLSVSVAGSTKSKTIEKNVATTPGQLIEVNGVTGSNVTFHSWDKDEVYVKLMVTISSSDKEYEDAYIAAVDMNESKTSQTVRLRLQEIKSDWSLGSWIDKIFGNVYINKEVTGDIYLPRKNPFTTDTRYGTMLLDGMQGEVRLLGVSNSLTLRNCTSLREIENNYGTTIIESSGGNLRLEGTSSKVTISDFKGKISLDVNYSTVHISRTSDNVSVADQSGEVTIDDAAGDTRIDANYSTITLNRIKGFADVKSTSGTVKARNVGGINVSANYSNIDIINVDGSSGKQIIIKSQSGELTMENIEGDLKIDNPYSRIDLMRIKGNVSLNSTSATVDGEDITGDWSSRTQYSSITLRALSAKSISMTNSSNPISIICKTVPSSVAIQNTYGGVSLRMPSGFSGDVELDAEYGEVNTNLPIKSKSRSGSGFAQGRIGSGPGTITVETKSGNIELMEK